MWVVKGVLLGFVIFSVGTLAYVVVLLGIGMYRLGQAVKAGAVAWRPGIAVAVHSASVVPARCT